MKSLIVGGGKIGYNLLKTLKERGNQVTLIESDRDLCLKISEDLDTDVIFGDGTNLEVLKDAGIEDADIIAAVTGKDEENLVICQIAKMISSTKKTIARINNPKNIAIFKTLGIDNTVCSTAVIANLIECELDNQNYRIISTLERGAMVLAEMSINEKSIWNGKKIKDLVLPEECVFVSVLRGEKVIYPRGDTLLLSGDKVLIVSNNAVLPALAKELYGRGNKL
jgi:trk system potassium uptake protein TrkA